MAILYQFRERETKREGDDVLFPTAQNGSVGLVVNHRGFKIGAETYAAVATGGHTFKKFARAGLQIRAKGSVQSGAQGSHFRSNRALEGFLVTGLTQGVPPGASLLKTCFGGGIRSFRSGLCPLGGPKGGGGGRRGGSGGRRAREGRLRGGGIGQAGGFQGGLGDAGRLDRADLFLPGVARPIRRVCSAAIRSGQRLGASGNRCERGDLHVQGAEIVAQSHLPKFRRPKLAAKIGDLRRLRLVRAESGPFDTRRRRRDPLGQFLPPRARFWP